MNPLQYSKVISSQLIKLNEKKILSGELSYIPTGGKKKKKYYHEIKSLYFQVVTHVLVDSFHLIPGARVSWGKTLWVGKRSWKRRSDDKEMNKLKLANMLFSLIFTEDCSQKGVFSGVFEEPLKKRGARVHKVKG